MTFEIRSASASSKAVFTSTSPDDRDAVRRLYEELRGRLEARQLKYAPESADREAQLEISAS